MVGNGEKSGGKEERGGRFNENALLYIHVMLDENILCFLMPRYLAKAHSALVCPTLPGHSAASHFVRVGFV